MDGLLSQTQSRERSRGPPSYPRAPSRSSTSTTNTRATPQSTNSSSSHLANSPQLSGAQSHRYHHGSNPKPGTPRPAPPMLSRETSSESRHSVATSSYLHEKLQRERKVEGERSAAAAASVSRMASDLSTSLELRASQSSPVRSSTSDSRRPRSSGGDGTKAGELTKKKGMGVKEMEQVGLTGVLLLLLWG